MRSAQTVAGKWLGPMSLPTAMAVAVMVLVLGWPVGAQVRAGASRQGPALHIVVIEGEDAVNIIQQKTAVAPVVEVRDRNDQPVAGAVVSFAIRNGRATFAGARTLSVTTNAAGRAVAAGFAPTGSGALQISATAALQGQTAAAVTITQTTVQTAAQAAAVSGAGSTGGAGGAAGGGAGAGGGGLSASTLGIIGGVAAGGALVATQVLDLGGSDGGGTKYRGPFNGQWVVTASQTGPGAFSATCFFDRAFSGTMTLTLEQSNGTANGQAEITATQTLTGVTGAPNCSSGGEGPGGPWSIQCAVSGAPGNLSCSQQATSTAGSVTAVKAFTFSGALSGGVVSGTVTYAETSQGAGVNPGGPFTTASSASTTFPVTLTTQ